LPKFRHVMQKPAVMSGRTRPGAADPPQFADPRASGPAATAGLSVLPLSGPPNGAARRHALTHRPNSGTRPRPPQPAFQRHSGAAGPPSAFKSARAAGWSSFNSPIAGCTMIRCSGPAGISSAACAFHRNVMKLDSTLKLAVYILRVIVCITVLSIILLIWLSA
jgi:hypothetical protein